MIKAKAPSKQEQQHPNWVFTIQFGGPSQPSCEDLKPTFDKLEKLSTYLIGGKEKAPTTGQEHIQGYVELKKPARRTELIKIIACFWEPAKGTGEQNRDYCSKEGDFYEVGEPKEQHPGKREQCRWEEAREEAEAGKRVTDAQIAIAHYSALGAIRRDNQRLPSGLSWTDGTTPNVWFYGEAGTGKSRRAREDYPDAYLKSCNKWWCGYQGQANVIIDDVDQAHACLGHYFKIWGDRYPFSGEVKLSSTALRPQVICITSQYSIDEIWTDAETRQALHRRYKSIRIGLPSDAPALLKAAFNSPTAENKRSKILGLEEEDETDENEQTVSSELAPQELPRVEGEELAYPGFPLGRSNGLGPLSSFTHPSKTSSEEQDSAKPSQSGVQNPRTILGTLQIPGNTEVSVGKKGFWPI